MLFHLLCFTIFLNYVTFGEEIQCTFIHGAGLIPDEGENLDLIQTNIYNLPQKLKDYWGIKSGERFWGGSMEHGPCTSYSFTYLNTVEKRWDDELLAEMACAATQNFDGKKPVKQRIFLHSMGTLIFFNALKHNMCKINKANTTIYTLAGPLKGSRKAQKAQAICMSQRLLSCVAEHFDFLKTTTIYNVAKTIANTREVKSFVKDSKNRWETVCDLNTGRLTPAFQSLAELTDAGDETISRISEELTDGAICGTQADDTPLNLFIKYFEKDDGIVDDGAVHIESCMAVKPSAAWDFHPLSDFWIAGYGHNEIIGRLETPEVLSWLKNRQ